MDTKALVNLTMTSLSCTQRSLAELIGASPAQVRLWKNGRQMPDRIEGMLRELSGIGRLDPEFVLMAGSVDQAEKWARMIHVLADFALEDAETGYDTAPLQRDIETRDILISETFNLIRDLGVKIPKVFPVEIDFGPIDSLDDDSHEHYLEALENNVYSSLIKRLYEALNDLYGFYAAYISELYNDDELELFDTPAENIEPCLLSLAACKIDFPDALCVNAHQYRHKVISNYEKWLGIVKERAFRAGVAIRAEPLNLVYDCCDSLGHAAEAEALGFNTSRLHPDVHMNELLVGMRIIHQVLPTIMEKLNITDSFKLDTSELALGRRLDNLSGLVRDPPFDPTSKGEGAFDVFISHASEDKDAIVRTLANCLISKGLKVWYDEMTLRIGDSLRQKIDKGLASSRVGLVVLSPAFIRKGWTNHELDGIVTRSLSGEQVLLPIWHQITKQEVMDFSPSLADKVARSTTTHTVDEIATEICELLDSRS
ncbi:transcriptional regulator with XRE-family HTH domain [Stenotrophomonas sp. 2619]|uniref:toll/interleukin-1 receptor domain-containing protein n=1 Tax=Stenotrophomonas sp. 2619 TaxID=3156316 RepID=UPI003392127D